MLDEFLQVAYETQTRKQAEYELVGLLKELPDLELRKIASGTPVSDLYGYLGRAKQAYSSPPETCSKEGDADMTFLDRFKGSPLFEQAMALEQQELEAEMQDIQRRQQERAEEKAMPRLWDLKDQIRLKKRLLELQLARQEMGGTPGAAPAQAAPASPDTPAQGAGAMGGVPAEGVQDNAMGVQGGKTASAVDPRARYLVDFAEDMGRALARADYQKVAAEKLKTALNLGALGGMAKNVGSAALHWASKNPVQAAGVAGGAALGAMNGGGVKGALTGGVTGGVLTSQPARAAMGSMVQKAPGVLQQLR